MTEQFAASYAESRRRQLGFANHDLGYQQIILRPGEQQKLSAVNKMFLLVRADNGIRVTSSTGQYYLPSVTLSEQKHEHSGQLTIQNNAPMVQTVTFVVVSWRNYVGKAVTLAPKPA